MNARKKLNKYQKEALFISGYFNSTNNHNMANEKDYEDIEFIAKRLQKISEAYAKQQAEEQRSCTNCLHQFRSMGGCSGCSPNYTKWEPKQQGEVPTDELTAKDRLALYWKANSSDERIKIIELSFEYIERLENIAVGLKHKSAEQQKRIDELEQLLKDH